MVLREVPEGLLDTTLCLREPAPGLVQSRLERPGIDLEQQVTPVDKGAFPVSLAEQIPGDLAADFGIDAAVQRADPFFDHGNVLRVTCATSTSTGAAAARTGSRWRQLVSQMGTVATNRAEHRRQNFAQ